MRRSDIGSGEAVVGPPVAECGQASDDVSDESGSNETWDVLQEHVSGSKNAKTSSDLGPEPPLVVSAASRAGVADRLAREPREDEIDVDAERFPVDLAEVAKVRDTRPMPLEDPGACRVELGLGDDDDADGFKAEVEAPGTAAERDGSHVTKPPVQKT